MNGVPDARADRGSIGALLAAAARDLKARSETARLDAELLLAVTAGLSRATLHAYPERTVSDECARRFRAAVERRARGEPLAYLTGEKEFYSLALSVTPDVLVPREETELLVAMAIERLDADGAASVLDLGAGSGAIALAIKHQRPAAQVTAADSDAAALAVARDNGRRLGLDVRFVESHWFDALRGERFDLVVANPPYVQTDDPHFAAALKFEPRLALDGGSDGLDAYRAILAAAPRHLEGQGSLLLEHGHDQRAALLELAARHGFEALEVRDDLAGIPRVAVLKVSRA